MLLLNYCLNRDVYPHIFFSGMCEVWLSTMFKVIKTVFLKDFLCKTQVPCLHVEGLKSGWCHPGSLHCHPGCRGTRWGDGGSSVEYLLADGHEPPPDHCRENGLRKIAEKTICWLIWFGVYYVKWGCDITGTVWAAVGDSLHLHEKKTVQRQVVTATLQTLIDSFPLLHTPFLPHVRIQYLVSSASELPDHQVACFIHTAQQGRVEVGKNQICDGSGEALQ